MARARSCKSSLYLFGAKRFGAVSARRRVYNGLIAPGWLSTSCSILPLRRAFRSCKSSVTARFPFMGGFQARRVETSRDLRFQKFSKPDRHRPRICVQSRLPTFQVADQNAIKIIHRSH